MDLGEISYLVPIVTHNGVEVLECLCGIGLWQIKRCPPKFKYSPLNILEWH
jgi:hypothetical protein